MRVSILLILGFAGVILLSSSTCNDRGPGIRYRETINVLPNLRPAVTPSMGRSISGFRLGSVDGDSEVLRTATFGPVEFEMPAAGPEFGVCNDGELVRRAYSGGLVRILHLIGDTGAEDISTDDNCKCDTRIDLIAFHPIEVIFADDTSLRIPEGQLTGNSLMCPNISHATSEARDFNGRMIARFMVTLRVTDDASGLFADVEFDLRNPRT